MLNKTIRWDEVRSIAFSMEKTVHILLADDDYQVLSALRCVIEQEPSWLVANEFHNAEEMILHFESASQLENTCGEHAERHASILLIDWELPGFKPKFHIPEIRSLCPQIKIVGLSVLMTARREHLTSQLDAFVSKSDAPERVIAALHDLILQLFPTQ
jgi:DNA-binding NarL/FixJ family response regulator